MLFYNDFIGNSDANVTLKFVPGDTQEKFIRNKKNKNNDWYYNRVEINYTFNSFGHRCKDIKELDFDNYFLFIGCSHTQGVGVELEKTYPYIVSKYLKADYYNMSLAATGIDVCEYNLLTWFAKFDKKPKAVFIQWPDHSRFIGKNIHYKNMITYGTWQDSENYRKVIVNGENTGFFNARKKIAKELVNNVVDVPTFYITFGSLDPISDNSIYVQKLDYARDLLHSGIRSHFNCATLLLGAYEREVSKNQ